MRATAKAHTNIALIKYWGKRNEELILPTNSSLSVTLDGFYTRTTVHFKNELQKDVFTLNDKVIKDIAYERVTNYLELFRNYANKQGLYAEVNSINKVPTAAGFASSASGFAALAAATAQALKLDLSEQELSKFTRQGSGSACRSIYGGFVEWQKGQANDGSDSYAIQIAPQDHWDIRVAAVVLTAKEKDVSSRVGMKRTVDTSVFYDGWLDSLPADLEAIKEGIVAKDFEKVGSIAEANCLKMHATTLGAVPPFTYWQDTTMTVMQTVQSLRKSGFPAYFTIDAGPNVKVLYLPKDEQEVLKKLRQTDGVTDVIVSKVGEGISYV
ncbi:diphosphomevalonate decarboxylase [Pseudogracilibacillus sp. SE30717A]|uniref:diphosphomevalonate decarboxylase n=1 Tax=Pseudogracilibacillus sp. SE30717A TaxID=3098293 RepID=UPI00300DF23A